MRVIGVAVVSLALISLAQSVNAASRDSSPMKRILILGDSLSAGFGLRPNQAYPALLTEKLRAASLNFEIINASQSGGTTEGGLRRLPAHLKRKIDIFILELGINDAFRGVPIAEIRSNLQAIIDMVKARNPNLRIIIAGMQLPNYASDDYVFAFGQIYADLAGKNDAALIPYLLEGVSGDPLLNQPDRIHPNAAGQKILAENVWRVLEPIARETASHRRTLDKEKMDPARPNDPDPSDPFYPERADHAILETIEIATEGEDCDECVRKLRPVLMKIRGVQDVTVDLQRERVIVKFDARKTHAPDLHDAILKSGYKPAPEAD